jgi:hypothetical protein
MRVNTLRLGVLAVLCALAALTLLAGAPARAAGPVVQEESAVSVTSASVTLDAAIDPHGVPTSSYFEYGTSVSYGSTAPALPGVDLGAGEGAQSLSVHVQGLAAGTVYHYRVVAVGELEGAPVTVDGPDQTFITQATGGESMLPDGRAWEMVSPPSKQGAGIRGVGFEEGAEIQAAANGNGITYAANSPFVLNPAGNKAFESSQIISSRLAPGAWETQDIATPHTEGATFVPAGNTSEYKLFSNDLSLGLVEPDGHTPLPPLPAGSEKTMYLRTTNGEYKALVTSENVTPGAKFGGNGEAVGGVQLLFATPDLSHVVIRSSVGLVAGDGPGLYEWLEGQLVPVSVLPNGKFTEGGDANGEVSRPSISKDGSRIVFQGQQSGPLYLRDMARGETVQLDAPQEGQKAGNQPSVYGTANSEGSRAFFASPERLTVDSTATAGASDLYVFEVTSGRGEPLAGKLTDLTVDGNVGESAGVQSVIGASEDGSYVYFLANGVLGDAAGHGAGPGNNLYFERYDAATKAWTPPVFIAALANGDRPTWTLSSRALTSRVSPNGRYLAFMSERSLTGYENHDANSGVADEEVFLYDASTGHLACVSCNPTGARPVGVVDTNSYASLFEGGGNWGWMAANIPGWTNIRSGHAFYQSRYLSNSGRLFFNSADALVPADVNGKVDVYEYEPAGVGSCQGASHGASASDVFSEAAGGCVGLISAGTSSEESAFLDASETGGDVFFVTQSRLAAQDYDTSYDVYDAHECTSSSPCAPSPPLTPLPCVTGDACKPSPTPQPTIFGAPSSETFSGAGNIVPAASKPVVSARSTGGAQKLARALRACRRRPRRRRAGCESQARKRYGTRPSRVAKSQSAKRGR